MEVANQLHAQGLEFRLSFWASAPEVGKGQWSQESQFVSLGDLHQAIRFIEVGGHFGNILGRCDPHGDVEPDFFADASSDVFGDKPRRTKEANTLGDVEKGLIQGKTLNQRRIALEDGKDRLGSGHIGFHPGLNEDPLGTETLGDGSRLS